MSDLLEATKNLHATIRSENRKTRIVCWCCIAAVILADMGLFWFSSNPTRFIP